MSDDIAEQWRPIPGASNYEASTLGRIRTLDRIVRAGRGGRGERLCLGKVLKPRRYSPYGHENVGVRTDDGRHRNIPVHVLVCRAFHGDKPTPKHEVRHLNGAATDCRPENLCWGTRLENVADRQAMGNHRSAGIPGRAPTYIGPTSRIKPRRKLRSA